MLPLNELARGGAQTLGRGFIVRQIKMRHNPGALIGLGRYFGGAEQKPWGGQGFTAPNDILYRGVKVPRVSTALGLFDLRRAADLPHVGRPSNPRR